MLERLVLPSGLGYIGVGAFADCTNIGSILYKGTERLWANVYVDSYNTPFDTLDVEFAERDVFDEASLREALDNGQNRFELVNDIEINNDLTLSEGQEITVTGGVCLSFGENAALILDGSRINVCGEGSRLNVSAAGTSVVLRNDGHIWVDGGSVVLDNNLTAENGEKIGLNVTDIGDVETMKSVVSGTDLDNIHFKLHASDYSVLDRAISLANSYGDMTFDVAFRSNHGINTQEYSPNVRSITLTEDFTVPSNLILTLGGYDGLMLNLLLDGEVTVNGSVRFEPFAALIVNGKLTLADYSGINAPDGTQALVVEEGGEVHICAEAFVNIRNINNLGSIVSDTLFPISADVYGNPIEYTDPNHSIDSEDVLRTWLEDDDYYGDIFVTESFTVASDLTVPEGKRLVLLEGCTLTFTENACLTVEGELRIDQGSTLDASDAAGFFITRNCYVELSGYGQLKINGDAYQNRSGGRHIFVIIPRNGDNFDLYESISGIDKNEYNYHVDVSSDSELSQAKNMAVSNSTYNFDIFIRTDLSVSGYFPENVYLGSGCCWNENGAVPVTVTVDEGKTLGVNGLGICDFGNTVIVNGTLDTRDGWVNIDGVGYDMPANTLIVNGNVELGYGGIFVGDNSRVENNGEIRLVNVQNVDCHGIWDNNPAFCSNAASTEDELAEMLRSDDLYEVFICDDLTIDGDVTIPQNKRLHICGDGTTLTVNGSLTVEGELNIGWGCTAVFVCTESAPSLPFKLYVTV